MANYVYATDPRKPIPIGVQGENDARTVVFDIHSWIEDYGNGSALLVHQRPGDAEPYPVTTAQKAGTVEWTVQQADIIAGAPGRAQLSYQVGENIVARSPIYMTVAADEITNTPLADYDPAKSWIDDLLDAVNKAGDITSDVQAAQTAATQAGQSATAAAGSASDAEESATAAANSAEQAAQHAGEVTAGVAAAAESASQAAGSASAAEASKTAAGQSAAAAAESEGNAAESASAAASSASAAQEAAESAQEHSGKPPIIQNDTWWTWDAETDKYEDTGHPATGEAAGFGSITATVDNAVGVPVVTVTESGSNTAKNLAFAFKNLKGEPGTAAGFGEATASVDGSTGAPDVTVSVSGPDTAKVFDFRFSGLKGQTGEAAGFGEITATVGATVGTPSVSVETSGPDTAKNLAFTFTNLKGEPGQSVGSIQRTTGTGAPGTTDTYTMYDDGGGTIGTFTVYNGTDGTGSGDFKADGSVPMTGDLNAGEHKIINVAAPTADGDAANKAYVDSQSAEIVKTASGSVINVSGSADYRLLGLKLYGKSVQDGTPTPEAPVEIESAGDGGDITTTICGTNLLDFSGAVGGTLNGITATITGDGGYTITGTLTTEPAINVWFLGNYTGNISVMTLYPGTYTCKNVVLFYGQKSFGENPSNITANSTYTFNVQNKTIVTGVRCVSGVVGTTYNETLYPILVRGSSLPEWEPYTGKTLTYPTPTGLPGIPVESGENFTDAEGQRWICDEVDFGAGKKTQRVGVIDSYNSESVGDVYMSSTGQLTTGAKVLYPLSEPTETDLAPEQITAYATLTTYKPNTTITTDSSPAAGIEVKYLTDSGVSEVLDYYASKADLDGKQDKLTGTTGQFVGFDADGNAEAQEITAADVGAVAADGSTAMAGDFDAGGHRVTNVGAPTAAGDAVRQSDLQAISDEIDAIIAGTTPVAVPVATDAKAGVVMPGEHLSVQADGALNAEWPDLSGYLTEIPAEYITEDELTAKGYLTAVPAEYVTDSELTGKGYATTADVAETYAKKALKFTGTFTAAGWTSATGGYSQTINVSGLTADDEPIIDLNSTATDADTFNGQLEAFGLVSNFTTGAGTLTAVVLGDSAPTVEIPIHGVVVY